MNQESAKETAMKEVARKAYKIRLVDIVDKRGTSKKREDNNNTGPSQWRSPCRLPSSSKFSIHPHETLLTMCVTQNGLNADWAKQDLQTIKNTNWPNKFSKASSNSKMQISKINGSFNCIYRKLNQHPCWKDFNQHKIEISSSNQSYTLHTILLKIKPSWIARRNPHKVQANDLSLPCKANNLKDQTTCAKLQEDHR